MSEQFGYVAAFLFLLSTFGTVSVTAGGVGGWNYHRGEVGGPETWEMNFTDCGGVMQSPIDIITSEAIHSPILPYFDFSDYRMARNVKMTLVNVGGHTAEVDFSGAPIYIRGGGLPADYKLIQFHFHWGEADAIGSEHYVDGKHFPMEVHFVHQQAAIHNASLAMQHPFGLAVLGFFFQLSEEDNPKLQPLLKHFKQIESPDKKTMIDSFPLITLLPSNRDQLDFYRYYGSLTTPPCYETVIWSLFTEYINISESQLNVFRSLYETEHEHLVNDFRPVQPLNKRIVITTKSRQSSSSATPLAEDGSFFYFSLLIASLFRFL
ncbi:Carbonic anhydrase 7 [Bulinus truncatus]|nr:Carbonic anhydrase 7 [Bulinus truncatus]